jgi:hypothetical protein
LSAIFRSMVSMSPVSSPTSIMLTTSESHDLGLAEGLGEGLALADRVVHLAQRLLEDVVAAGLLGDGDGLEDRHAGGDQRARASA